MATTKKLTGSDLLAMVREMKDAPKQDIAKACGYYTVKPDGTERYNFTQWYDALLEAQGLEIKPATRESSGSPGRQATFVARVQSNNNIIIGKAYTLLHNYKPNDEFKIEMSENEIRLIKIADAADVVASGAKRPGRKPKSKSIEQAVLDTNTPSTMTSEEWSEEQEKTLVEA